MNLSGYITVKRDTILDYDRGERYYGLSIKAVNSAGESGTVAVYINILNVHDIPEIDSVSLQIKENSTSSIQLSVNIGDSPITEFVLSGEHSDLFNIDLAGRMTLRDGVVFDYDRGIRYFLLSVEATNASGISLLSSVEIEILDVHDIPVIKPLSIAVDENSDVIGTLEINNGNSSIKEFLLSGENSEYFHIDLNGTIFVESNYSLDYDRGVRYFSLSVQAINEAGASIPSNIHIYVQNVHDIPEVNSFSIVIDENSRAGNIIGKLSINEGESSLIDIQLYNNNDNYGYGNEFFSVDLEGNIRLEKTIYLEEYSYYSKLYVIAKNSLGESVQSNVYITVRHNQKDIYSRENQAILVGPLSGANVELIDMDSSEVLFAGLTSETDSLLRTGIISFPSSITERLIDEHDYLVKVNGGVDVDPQSIGKISKEPKQNSASLHAIVSGRKIKTEYFKVNILTEIAYQVFENEEVEEIQKKLDKIGQRLLEKDVNNDNIINYDDLLKWIPFYDKNKLLKKYSNANNYEKELSYQEIINQLYSNEDIYENAYLLAYEIYFKNKVLYVDENATVGTVVGEVHLDLFDGNVSFHFEEDSEMSNLSMDGLFSISDNGKIIIKDAVLLDYETTKIYNLIVTATIEYEDLLKSEVKVIVHNINDAPTLKSVDFLVKEDSNSSIEIGKIEIVSDGPITSIILEGEGSNLFSISKDVILRIVDNVEFNYRNKSSYNLQAYAVNKFGISKKVNVNINIDLSIGSFENINEFRRLNAIDTVLSSDEKIAFVLNKDRSLVIIDISNLTAPIQIGEFYIGTYLHKIVISKNNRMAYITSNKGLYVLDISDTHDPKYINSYYERNEYFTNIELSKDEKIAYLSSNGYGDLKIIDIENPLELNYIGTFGNSIAYMKISSDGNTAYALEDWAGLKIYDISDPLSVTLLGSYNTPDNPADIVLSEDEKTIYLVDDRYHSYNSTGESGLHIIDISDVSLPVKISQFDTPGFAENIKISKNGNMLYITDDGHSSSEGEGGEIGLIFINITNKYSPVLEGSYNTKGYANSIVISNDEKIAYISDKDGGLQIIDISSFLY